MSEAKVSKPCERCGKVFESWIKRNRRYCSKSCSSIVNIRAARERGEKRGRGKEGFIRPCVICGSDVYVKPFQEKKGHGLCCSKGCKDKYQARNSVSAPCGWCGKEMVMSPFRATIQKFCSWQCQREGRRTNAIDKIHNGRRARVDDDGYVYVWEPDHPNAHDGWMAEHRLIVEAVIGRYLVSNEHVHHINGVKDDNTPQNLIPISPSEHRKITNADYHAKLKQDLAELEEYRRRFGPLEEK
jgi:hypothetical protein